jgi:chorismate mutase/prephenate dehydratase
MCMTTETTTPERTLADVRREIDAIDDALHDLLIKRAEVVAGVAEAKARTASEAGEGSFIAFRPGREAEILRRLAARHEGDLPLRVVFRLWREIIAAMTRIQGPFRVEVFGGEAGEALAYWDLARSYYGSSTPMEIHGNARDVLRRLGNDRSAVGVLPAPSVSSGGDWWAMLAANDQSKARVVARLPFVDIESENGSSARALVVAQADFERTGEDTSLLVISATETISETRIAALTKAAGLSGLRIGNARLQDGADMHMSLVAVPEYLEEDDARLAALAEAPIARVRVIGGYANPLIRATDGE